MSPGLNLFQYIYQISPIILLGGLAGGLPNSAISIASFIQNTFGPLTAPGFVSSLDEAFAQFLPLPGSTLIDQDIGTYPFANQATAANAVITKPLSISFKMIAPARGPDGFAQKQATMTALRQTLNQHNLMGGLYACATPSFLWDNCVMRAMRDITPEGEGSQRQVVWQLDFEQSLVTQQQAQQQYNLTLAKAAAGAPLTPNAQGQIPLTGGQVATGNPPSVTPVASNPSVGIGSSGTANASLGGFFGTTTGPDIPN